jgi:hypothetical protein
VPGVKTNSLSVVGRSVGKPSTFPGAPVAVPDIGPIGLAKSYIENEGLASSKMSSVIADGAKAVSWNPTVGVGTWVDMEKLEKTAMGSVNVAVTIVPSLSTTVTVAGPTTLGLFDVGFMIFIVSTFNISSVTVPLNGFPPRVPEAVVVSI